MPDISCMKYNEYITVVTWTKLAWTKVTFVDVMLLKIIFFSLQAYLEFFTSKSNIRSLLEILKEYPQVNYHIVDEEVCFVHTLFTYNKSLSHTRCHQKISTNIILSFCIVILRCHKFQITCNLKWTIKILSLRYIESSEL